MTKNLEVLATVLFVAAIAHTFLVKHFQHLAKKYPEGSAPENFFHLLGEVEIVFGLWAGVFLSFVVLLSGTKPAIDYIQSRNFNEPAFVFVIMAVCSTRPILRLATTMIESISKRIPISHSLSFFMTTLIVGPLLGSFITEPAAMTVTALILVQKFYSAEISEKLKYATIGLLFVNISIGGTLTPFAAPPILMVAPVWGWDFTYMVSNFGWKGVVACCVSTFIVGFRFRNEISAIPMSRKTKIAPVPLWITILHIFFLILIVLSGHYSAVFLGVFLFFLGLASVTQEHQDEIRLKEGLLVGFFLAGLVVLGGPQRWWLEPILTRLQSLPLYLGAMGLTAFTDNAAITYLGSLVPGLSDASKYGLVAGSVVGGGLTVIANAPNPAGYGILNASFGKDGISPARLFFGALLPTLIAAICFWFL